MDLAWVADPSGAVTLLSSLALTFFTWRLVVLTRSLANETKLTRLQKERADVQLAVEPHPEHLNAVELVIANVGAAAARGVEISVRVIMPEGDKAIREPRNLRLDALLPGSRHRLFVGSFLELKASGTVIAEVTYSDSLGRHDEKIKQPLSGWSGFGKLGSEPGYEAAKALSKIANTIDQWNGFRRLAVDVYDTEDRRRSGAEVRTWLQGQQGVMHQPPNSQNDAANKETEY